MGEKPKIIMGKNQRQAIVDLMWSMVEQVCCALGLNPSSAHGNTCSGSGKGTSQADQMARKDCAKELSAIRNKAAKSKTQKLLLARADELVVDLKKAQADFDDVSNKYNIFQSRVNSLRTEKDVVDREIVRMYENDPAVKEYSTHFNEHFGVHYRKHLEAINREAPDKIPPEGQLLLMATQFREDITFCETKEDAQKLLDILKKGLDKFREEYTPVQ
jgi:isocitrate lyase